MRYLLVLAMLAGCATPEIWVKPSGTDAQLERDVYDCERDAAPVRDRWHAEGMINRCLRLKGWSRQ